MKKFLFTISALIAFGANALAADIFEVEDVDILPASGSQANIVVNYTLDAESSCGGYDFKITLPAGIEPIMDEDEITYELGDCYKKAPSVVTGYTAGTRTLEVHVACGDALQKQSGTLMTIPVKATSALTLGPLDAQLHNADFIDYTTTFAHVAADVDFSFIVSNTVILDETSIEAPAAATGVNVKVKRTISANNWNTLCLPFDMTAEQVKSAFGDDVQVAELSGFEYEEDPSDEDYASSFTLKFTSVTSITKNKPCVIKVGSAITQFTVSNVNIEPEAAEALFYRVGSKSSGRAYFYGTYVAETTVPTNRLFLSGNKFYYATSSTQKMKGFRGFFETEYQLKNKNLSSSAIAFIFDGEETTNIEGLQIVNGDGRIYNLNGQHVENPTSKGVYIQNGKKVVMKK